MVADTQHEEEDFGEIHAEFASKEQEKSTLAAHEILRPCEGLDECKFSLHFKIDQHGKSLPSR